MATRADYGFTEAFLAAVPEVRALVDAAVAQSWTPQKFTMAVQDTGWFKSSSDTARAATQQATQDPAAWQQRVTQAVATLRVQAGRIGATLSDAELTRLAGDSLKFGFNEAQLGSALGAYVNFTSGGTADQALGDLRMLAIRNGLTYGEDTLQNWARGVATGGQSIDTIKALMHNAAASSFPAWAEQINAGADVMSLAEPYMQTMAQTLELNAGDIDLRDNTLRQAMQGVGADGKPASMPIWQFERNLRKDARWRQTDNAKETLSTAARGVLKDFGFGY